MKRDYLRSIAFSYQTRNLKLGNNLLTIHKHSAIVNSILNKMACANDSASSMFSLENIRCRIRFHKPKEAKP